MFWSSLPQRPLPPAGAVKKCPAHLLGAGFVGVLVAGFYLTASAEQPSPPPHFAIRNARIVPVSSPPLEKGTIVIANGVITAVGSNLPIPPEAWVIDGEGRTVYPGLIDSLTNLGLEPPPLEGPPSTATPPPVPQPRREPIARGPEDRPGTASWENAADQLHIDDKRIENWRKAGFTSVVTVNEKGILPGQAALINLAGERAEELVVRTPVALRTNLNRAGNFWSFPNSLMGVLAYIRQTFLDAQQNAQAWRTYNAQPAGLERPPYDRTLEPLETARVQRLPVLIPAVWAKEIHRALQLGDEIGANTLLYGAHQGYAVAEHLAARKTAVLVSLNWPEKAKDADPEAEEPLRVLRFRDRAPSTPAAFHQAGVRFAFYSDGLANPTEILQKARKAMHAGLPTDAALRAFTLSAAEIYGVADRLGSLEVGKIANLVVTDSDLFEEQTRVQLVFIDGRKYEIREHGRPTEPPGVNLSGRWALRVNTPQGVEERSAELTMTKDGTLTGTVTGRRGTATITSGWVSGHKFSFTLTFSVGPRTMEATYTGAVEGNRLSGTIRAGQFSADFTGTRPQQAR